MNRKRYLVILTAAVVVALGIFAISSYSAVPTQADTGGTPPVTTSNAVASYTGQAVITLTATDPQSVKYIYNQVDYSPPDHGAAVVCQLDPVATTGTCTVTVAGPAAGSGTTATHTITYWAQGADGIVEAKTTQSFTIAAAKTATAATLKSSAAKVRRNHSFKLTGAITPTATGNVTIQCLKPHTSTWKTLTQPMINLKGAYTYRYYTHVKGSWSFRSMFAGSASLASSTSNVVKVRVK